MDTPPEPPASDSRLQEILDWVMEARASTVPVDGPQGPSPDSAAQSWPLPEELNALLPKSAYMVESFIGQGGMGAVYKGVQLRLKRAVAIKIMRRDMGKDFDFEARFEHEAHSMASLNHPNIVSGIDYGEAGPGFLYIVMEYVEGADLMQVIRTGRMTQEMALSILPQICDALQFAHDQGIVHRDVKPGNILLTRDGRVKITDFGLAKRTGAGTASYTQSKAGMGTPGYAAPEQFIADASVDHRADIYALGVMIYQMITGSLPVGAFKPPSQRAKVAPEWDGIVNHAMQSDPKDRYQSASEVKLEVAKLRPGQDRAELTAKRWKVLFIAAAGIVAAVLVWWLLTHQASPPMPASPSTPSKATQQAPFVNSLGMKFVPVPVTRGPTAGARVLFSVWETRVRDFRFFQRDTHYDAVNDSAAGSPGYSLEQSKSDQSVMWKQTGASWQDPHFPYQYAQTEDDPACCISYHDAEAFCRWLTRLDHETGRLPASWSYRLPADEEWSCAAGTAEFPWGATWPPSKEDGNFNGLETGIADSNNELVKLGYKDGFPRTAMVASARPNAFGLRDMSGNVWEWTAAWYQAKMNEEEAFDHVPAWRNDNGGTKFRVLRGGAWTSAGRVELRSRFHYYDVPERRRFDIGFRLVVSEAVSAASSGEKAKADASGNPARPQ